MLSDRMIHESSLVRWKGSMSDSNSTSIAQKVFNGMPTRWQLKKREKEKEKCKLGVCAIRKQLGGRQGAPIEGTGFLVKDFYPHLERKNHIVTSEVVIPSNNLEGYLLCFKKLDSTDKTPLELASVVNMDDPIFRNFGLVYIPLDPGKFNKYQRSRSGLLNHRPFTKGIQHQGCELYCHIVEEFRMSHVIKPYQLLENENGQHSLRAFQQDSSRKLPGAPITTDVHGKAVVVGALTSSDKVSPIFFPHALTSSAIGEDRQLDLGLPVFADGTTASANISQRGKQSRDLADQASRRDRQPDSGPTFFADGATASANISQRGKQPRDLADQDLSDDLSSFEYNSASRIAHDQRGKEHRDLLDSQDLKTTVIKNITITATNVIFGDSGTVNNQAAGIVGHQSRALPYPGEPQADAPEVETTREPQADAPEAETTNQSFFERFCDVFGNMCGPFSETQGTEGRA